MTRIAFLISLLSGFLAALKPARGAKLAAPGAIKWDGSKLVNTGKIALGPVSGPREAQFPHCHVTCLSPGHTHETSFAIATQDDVIKFLSRTGPLQIADIARFSSSLGGQA